MKNINDGDSTGYVAVDARFTTPEEWLAHVRALPLTRPADLHVDFMSPGMHIRLTEGEYEFRQPWHCYVHEIRRWGIPGTAPRLAARWP